VTQNSETSVVCVYLLILDVGHNVLVSFKVRCATPNESTTEAVSVCQ
jgi:hypothetical protein